jgi:hypothetical protein
MAMEKRLRPAPDVHTRMFDDDLVIVDLTQGEYFALNEVGAALWTGLEQGRTIEQIADSLAVDHAVTAADALRDLTNLCKELEAKGLLVESR